MIPKVIHYCWFGTKPLPDEMKKYIGSWKKYAPDYEIVQWNETNFDVHSHPFMEAAYAARAWAFVSDYARLKIVHDNGGIYFDTDVELLKNPDFLLENRCFMGVHQIGKLCTTGIGFGAEKGSSVVRQMLEKYDEVQFRTEDMEKLACPALNNAVLRDLGYSYSEEIWRHPLVTVYPCRYFDPLSTGKTDNLMCGDTVSIHHYAATWTGKGNRLKRKLFRLIGEENVFKIKKILKR